MQTESRKAVAEGDARQRPGAGVMIRQRVRVVNSFDFNSRGAVMPANSLAANLSWCGVQLL